MKNRVLRIAAIVCVLTASLAEADIDWRSKGAVTPVKNQGELDVSWAFAAVGAVEGWNAATNGALISLSEQQLVDCTAVAGGACAVPTTCGQAPCGLNFAVSQGICTTTSYPYTARVGSCKQCIAAVQLPGWSRLVGESAIAGALNQAPVIARLEEIGRAHV